uniref:Uncharacterized protein n=1 Tax=Acrobeloides nanus TaxID=290746 RepID=A0A914E3C4_9BILA
MNNMQEQLQHIHIKEKNLALLEEDLKITDNTTLTICKQLKTKYFNHLINILGELIVFGNHLYFSKFDKEKQIRKVGNHLSDMFDDEKYNLGFYIIISDGKEAIIFEHGSTINLFLKYWFSLNKLVMLRSFEFGGLRDDLPNHGDSLHIFESYYSKYRRIVEEDAFKTKKEELTEQLKQRGNEKFIQEAWHVIDETIKHNPNISYRELINLLKKEVGPDKESGIFLMFLCKLKVFCNNIKTYRSMQLQYRESDGFYVEVDGYELGVIKMMGLCYEQFKKLSTSTNIVDFIKFDKVHFILGPCYSSILMLNTITSWVDQTFHEFFELFNNLENVSFYERKRFGQTMKSVQFLKIPNEKCKVIWDCCNEFIELKSITNSEAVNLLDLGILLWQYCNRKKIISNFKTVFQQLIKTCNEFGNLKKYVGLQVIEPFLPSEQTWQLMKNIDIRFRSKYHLLTHYLKHYHESSNSLPSFNHAIQKFPKNLDEYFE